MDATPLISNDTIVPGVTPAVLGDATGADAAWSCGRVMRPIAVS